MGEIIPPFVFKTCMLTSLIIVFANRSISFDRVLQHRKMSQLQNEKWAPMQREITVNLLFYLLPVTSPWDDLEKSRLIVLANLVAEA